MSRKTKSPRSAPSRRASSPHHWDVRDAPRVQRPLRLICGACGASGRYNVGTVLVDPTIGKQSDRNAVEDTVGFTGYFRCRKCDAGGPWELPHETFAYLTAMLLAAVSEADDVPLVFGCIGTFDKRTFRYATDCEAHLQGLIEREPERAFLWVRLGNLYSHTGRNDLAEPAYRRAIELDPKDIEAHNMLGQLLVKTGRYLDAVPHWHAVLRHVRDARQVDKDLRRELARGAIESLLEAHAQSNGQIDFLPNMTPNELEKRGKDEPAIVELREFNLGSEKGINDLCDMFLEQPRPYGRDLFHRRKKRVPRVSDDWPAEPIRREVLAVGRNDPCPCGSGQKYKKCCGQ